MTEEIPATPGWADSRLDDAFARLPVTPEVRAATRAYADCLATHKQPAAPSDLLGTEFNECRPALRRALLAAGVDGLDELDMALERIEAEIAGGS